MIQINPDDIQNGFWWESPTFNRYCTQWIDGDLFGLLTEDYQATHGGTARMFRSLDMNGTKFIPVEKMAEYLSNNRYRLISGEKK